tara:strand:- start:56746 stop:58281 length:1536 start_codon:yes stop_codon:yes gene_type:complete
MNYPAMLAFFCGFSSLSLEILWVRLYGFAQLSTPSAFGFVLMAYLIGIALGARAGSRVCQKDHSDVRLWGISIVALMVSGICSVALPSLFGWLLSGGFDEPISATLVIASTSAVLAFVFPIAHHLGANNFGGRMQGRRFATVYAANVAGGALGPLVTGYLLLDIYSLQQSFAVLALLQFSIAGVFALAILSGATKNILSVVSIFFCIVSIVFYFGGNPHILIEKIDGHSIKPSVVVENRQGIITIYEDGSHKGDDKVYGGNVYDGRTNTDAELNTNGLNRPLLLAALQPKPERVLVVGLSIGTWLAVVNEFPNVKHVDVVEINPGYLSAAQHYPIQDNALRDSRVNIIIDDARRWLRVNSDTQYDLIIMNTTWHWRSNASLLLSTEFLELIKSHMAEGAVMAFNATGSDDAFYTASQVFSHAYRYSSFVYAAGFDFRARKDDKAVRQKFSALQMNGKPMFDPGSGTINRFLDQEFVSIDEVQRGIDRPLEKISDENMITEFKYGKRLYWGF